MVSKLGPDTVKAYGWRKFSTATVVMTPGTGQLVVRNRDGGLYARLERPDMRQHILTPFVVSNTLGKFDCEVGRAAAPLL